VIHLVAAGDGTLKVYSNGSLLDTLSVATNVTFDTLTWKGFNGYVRLFTGAMTAGQITAEYNLLRSWIPEIEQVQIGSQVWASSNLQAVATPVGNVIAEMQAASAVEKITNATDREFSSDTGFWTREGTWAIGSGSMNRTANAGGYAFYRVGLLTAGKYYKIRYTLTISAGAIYVYPGVAGITRTASGTYTEIIKATSSTLQFIGNATLVCSIDDVSIQELGWVNATEIYDAVYAATAGTAAQKEYAALRESSMWCNYNNDTSLGAVYGKLYNWYSAKLLDLDMATAGFGWHIPTSTEFTTLQTYLGGASVAGGKMKMTGTNYWPSPNTGADNSSGFTSLGAGYRLDTNGTFNEVTVTTLIISSDAYYIRNVRTASEALIVNQVSNKARGFSIRLIKNS